MEIMGHENMPFLSSTGEHFKSSHPTKARSLSRRIKRLRQGLGVREGVLSLLQPQRPAMSSWPVARLWPAQVTGLRSALRHEGQTGGIGLNPNIRVANMSGLTQPFDVGIAHT